MKTYFEDKDLVSFGNYLMSDERDKTVKHETNKQAVTHADLENWKKQTNKQQKITASN